MEESQTKAEILRPHWLCDVLAARAGECILPLGVLGKLPLRVGREGGKLRHLLTCHLFVVEGFDDGDGALVDGEGPRSRVADPHSFHPDPDPAF